MDLPSLRRYKLHLDVSLKFPYNIQHSLFMGIMAASLSSSSFSLSPAAPSEPVDVTVEVFAAFGEMQINWSPPLSFGGTLINYYVTVTNTSKGLFIYYLIHYTLSI